MSRELTLKANSKQTWRQRTTQTGSGTELSALTERNSLLSTYAALWTETRRVREARAAA